MKKINYGIIMITIILLVTGCSGNEQKSSTNDTSSVKKTVSNRENYEGKKYLAFFDDSMLNTINEDKTKYVQFKRDFEIYPKKKYNAYHDVFRSLFHIGTDTSIFKFAPPSFSIYDKYNIFQSNLDIQTEIGIESDVAFEKRIRIYPAIDPSDNFYLVIMGERQDQIPPKPDPESNTYTSYSISGNTFATVASTAQAETDIRKFQSTWLNRISVPGYFIDTIRSFTYSIAQYNKLLSSTSPFWAWRSSQTVSNPRNLVKLFPIVIKDDPSYPNHVLFKLVLLPYTTLSDGTEVIDSYRGYFNHMDVCPDKCPSNSIQ